MKRTIYIVAAMLLSAACMSNTGCGGGGGDRDRSSYDGANLAEESAVAYDMAAAEPVVTAGGEMPLPAGTPETGKPLVVKDSKKIIKTGRMGIDVVDLTKAKAGVDGLVAAMGGYYLSEAFNESDYRTTCDLSIRIPSVGYEKFIAALEGAGYGSVSYKTIDARDVTEEFIDVETRLGNKREYLERYRQLLKKAVTIKEIMEIEEQVRALEEEIESAEGRLRYLRDQVSYSTLDLALVRQKDYKYTPPQDDNFREKTKQALSGGWKILKFVILLIIRLWPIWLIGGGISLIIIYLGKRRKRKE